MLTKRDISLLKQAFKEDFLTKEEAQRIFATKNGLVELREDILTFKDEILHEITAMRDEIGILVGYRDMIEDHENRLQKLEK